MIIENVSNIKILIFIGKKTRWPPKLGKCVTEEHVK